MIVFRADANERIASGHVMRCLSIADAFFALGEEVVFITADEYADKTITNRGYRTICLNSDWNDKEGELPQTISELKRLNPALLIVDSYQVTPRYLESLRQVTKTAYIDDLNAFDYPVDLVINYSIYAEELDYPQNKGYLLGIKYAPLRKQFDIPDDRLNKAISERENHKKILLTTGASDPYQVAGKTVEAILSEPSLNEYAITVVKGTFWNYDIPNSNRITILENVENMAELMLDSTMAVSSGGSTLYELCACCVPTVTFSYADNQLDNVKGFEKRDLMPYAGDARQNESVADQIRECCTRIHRNPEVKESIIEKMRSLKCGNGAERLSREIVKTS